MSPTLQRTTRLAPLLFFVGLAWLAVVAFAAAWPDMEAGAFDASTTLVADQPLRSLSCPLVLAADEERRVQARFDNPSDAPEAFLVRSRVSEGFVTVVREDSRQVALAPGGSTTLSWPVFASDAAYGRIVMVRVLATRSAVSPARQSACGILVVGIRGVPGRAIAAVAVLAGLAFVLAGAVHWRRAHRPPTPGDRRAAQRAGVLAAIVVASLVTGIGGLWLVSHLLLVVSALFAVLVVESYYSG